MTALCGGNTSSLKSGVGQQVVFSAALITEGLGLISPWLLPLAGLVDSFVYQATTQCGNDPPAMPSTAQLNPVNAIGGVINPGFSSWLTAVNNLLLNWAWSVYCQCNSGPQPTFTYPPPANVSQGATNTSSPCFTGSYSGSVSQFQNSVGHQNTLTQLDWPGTFATFTDSGGTVRTNATVMQTPLPVSVTFQGTVTFSGSVPNSCSAEALVDFFDSTGHGISAPFQTITNTNGDGVYAFSVQASVPPNAYYLIVTIDQVANSNCPLATCAAQIMWYCGGSPAGACCTDPAVLQLLNTLLQLTEAIYKALPVLPNSWAEATAHSGLTGSGTLTIAANCIAVKVSITTDLPGGRVDTGSPNYLFDRGYVVMITNEAPLRGYSRVVYNPQVFIVPHLADQVGYTFPAGEIVTITELTAGP